MDSVRRPAQPWAKVLSLSFLTLSLLLRAAPVLAAKGDCGQPSSSGTTPKSSDALVALKSAVGTADCDLCVCDVTNDLKITASDALRILKKAVGQNVTLTCPACVPTLAGKVIAPAAMVPLQLPAGASDLAEVAGPAAAALTLQVPIMGLQGLVPVSGATVELLNLDSEGNPQLPAVATTTTKADGSYRFQPAPAASSTAMVRATVGSDEMRAFVSDASTLTVDPGSEFVVEAAIDAVSHDAGADLGDLTVKEIDALVRLVRQTEVNLGASSSMTNALEMLEDRTGGVFHEYVSAFATSTGATPSIAGNFHLLNLGAAFSRQFTPSTSGTPSVNERRVHTYTTADPMVIDGSGTMTQPVFSGRNHTLKEISGSAQQQSGPDLAINASATIEHDNVYETPGSGAGTVLATDSGALLLADPYLVGAGAVAAGSDFGVLADASRLSPTSSLADLAFGVRQGTGMSKSSLSGTYWMVHLELELEATTGGNLVERAVGARTSTHTATFDGNGGFSVGAADDVSGRLHKTGPTPDQAPADTDVQLQVSLDSEPAAAGLTYTVDANGAVTAKEGTNVIGVGAVSADGRILVLRVGDEDSGFADSGIILGFKRGSGMSNSTASGTYRTIEFGMEIEASLVPGEVDVSPSSNTRAVGMDARLGHFAMDGAGHVAVARAVQRYAHLREYSGVQQYSAAPDLVHDATVEVTNYCEGDGDGTETHTYSVASNGKVTIDGSMSGYLSSDGKVFVLPVPESETGYASAVLLIGLREP